MKSASRAIPRRHGIDIEAGRRTGRLLKWMIRGEAEPSPQRWKALGEGLMQGDPLADRLLDWMHAAGTRVAMPQFQRVLTSGIASAPQAPAALRAFFAHCERRPAWVDAEKLAEGARAFQRMGMTSHY